MATLHWVLCSEDSHLDNDFPYEENREANLKDPPNLREKNAIFPRKCPKRIHSDEEHCPRQGATCSGSRSADAPATAASGCAKCTLSRTCTNIYSTNLEFLDVLKPCPSLWEVLANVKTLWLEKIPKEAHIQYISSSGLDARVPAFSLNVRHFCFKLVELAPSTYVDLGHCNTMSFRAVQTKNTMYFSA